jgi:hypothetical protein
MIKMKLVILNISISVGSENYHYVQYAEFPSAKLVFKLISYHAKKESNRTKFA